jgi:hypothetical protein
MQNGINYSSEKILVVSVAEYFLDTARLPISACTCCGLVCRSKAVSISSWSLSGDPAFRGERESIAKNGK